MPISDCQVRDPRIRRTRQLLQTALGTLMLNKSLDEISVQDITDAATLNRATFYDHYTDKYALLEAMVAGGFHKLLHDRQVRFDRSCDEAAGSLIRAVYDYLTHIEAGVKGDNQSAFAPLVDAALVSAVCRVVREGLPQTASKSPDMLAAAIGWALYGAVKQRLSLPKRPSAGTIKKQVLGVIQPLLTGLVSK